MKKVRFTHKIVVPSSKDYVERAKGYYEEELNVTTFDLSHSEFDDLRKENGLFDEFDKAFGTIIDDCEEDRIESDEISQAIAIAEKFLDRGGLDSVSGIQIVLQSLKCAKGRGVFGEIINGAMLYEQSIYVSGKTYIRT